MGYQTQQCFLTKSMEIGKQMHLLLCLHKVILGQRYFQMEWFSLNAKAIFLQDGN